MFLEKRFFDSVLLTFVTLLLIGGLGMATVRYSQLVNGNGVLEVKKLPSSKIYAPKVRYIPVKSKPEFKADISNAVLGAKAKRPVIINL